jgi:serine-type D-Ala-D-Ala carboxypeptidase/endopeptidase (penicillin-binding protein 4)
VVRITPGATAGVPARVAVGPPGHGLVPQVSVTTTAAGSAPALTIARPLGTTTLSIRGQIPLGGTPAVRTTTVDNPTQYFVEALRLALATRGIGVTGGAWDIDELTDPPSASPRRVLARHQSAPLSSLLGYAMKVSQNFYGEVLLKALGRGTSERTGSTERGRQAVQQTLVSWSLPTDALVMYDGSGLSRYNYVSAELVSGILKRVWHDEQLRGPFVAALPIGGRDGTLESRMRNTPLDGRVQAKTGTIANVRSLAGYLETNEGEKLAFAMIANHFTAPNLQIDAVMERALERLLR